MIGQLEAFKPDEEKISAYLERVQLFFAANEVKAKKQVPVLLSVIGYSCSSGAAEPTPHCEPSVKRCARQHEGRHRCDSIPGVRAVAATLFPRGRT